MMKTLKCLHLFCVIIQFETYPEAGTWFRFIEKTATHGIDYWVSWIG